MLMSALKLITRTVGAFLLLLVCTAAVCAIYSRNQRSRALRVMTSLNEVAVGTASEASIAAIVKSGAIRSVRCLNGENPQAAKEPCRETEEQYGLYLGFPYWLNRVFFEHPLLQYTFRYFEVHPWFVEISLTSRNGKINRIFCLTVVGRADRATVVSRIDILPKDLSEQSRDHLYTVFYVQERNLIPELHAWISPALPLQERTQLTDYRLDCLTTVKGCLEPAEISPRLWYEYKRQSQ